MFQAKNPFTPQVTTADPSTTSAAAPTTAKTPGADVSSGEAATAASAAAAAAAIGTTSVVPSTSAPAGTATAPTTAPAPTVAISVNGSVSHVAADGTFPEASPVFRLVSFANGTAQIGIVGGSYAAGSATLTLHLHTPVTLENQTDGKQYTLELDATP
jgi:hypothetical protein